MGSDGSLFNDGFTYRTEAYTLWFIPNNTQWPLSRDDCTVLVFMSEQGEVKGFWNVLYFVPGNPLIFETLTYPFQNRDEGIVAVISFHLFFYNKDHK